MYRFYMKQNGEQILLPVAPSELITNVEGESEKVDLVDIGEGSILKDIGLRRISFTVLLPAVQYSFVQTEGVFQPPIFFLNQFRQYKMSKKPVSLIVFRKLADGTELFSGNIDVSFERYTVLERGGEQGDFWVEINLKEYRKITSATYKMEQKEGQTVLEEFGVKREGKEIPNTYTVKKGDSLWKIAQTMLNDGSRYKEIAEKNNIVNPNKIQVGQILRLG
ncbi:MAG: LysM peptidoglycan-binding domain-containing protein [Firmicutes bacterium]|jgi:nucleoid-associated protein YgaU|nr:LysM peptidoglycan-binding domain-containing protein [Bacillota bacterium]